MGLFSKSKEEKERKELKGKIDKLMKDYSKEKIDSDTYFKKMMDLTTSHQKKKKKWAESEYLPCNKGTSNWKVHIDGII